MISSKTVWRRISRLCPRHCSSICLRIRRSLCLTLSSCSNHTFEDSHDSCRAKTWRLRMLFPTSFIRLHKRRRPREGYYQTTWSLQPFNVPSSSLFGEEFNECLEEAYSWAFSTHPNPCSKWTCSWYHPTSLYHPRLMRFSNVSTSQHKLLCRATRRLLIGGMHPCPRKNERHIRSSPASQRILNLQGSSTSYRVHPKVSRLVQTLWLAVEGW